MRKILMATMLGVLSIAPVVQATAQVNAKQLDQQRRIDAGRRSGKLTAREAATLKAEQRSIERLSKQLRARHGGHLTSADKRLIHSRQDRAESHILSQKRDSQRGKNKLKVKL